jgi:large subunit ribosomal protein L24
MSLLKKGDTVVLLSGAQRGTTGRILSIDRKKDRAIVEGLNLKYKHLRRSQENPQGGRAHREYPVNMANLAFWDADAGKGVRLGVQVTDGEKQRVTRPGGRVIDA